MNGQAILRIPKMALGIFALYMYAQNQFLFLFAQYVKGNSFYAKSVILNLNKRSIFCEVKDVKTKFKTNGSCFLPNMLISLLGLKKNVAKLHCLDITICFIEATGLYM